MTRKGFDLAAPLTATSATQFKALGYEFVCRYLVPSGWKHLTPEEALAISIGGLKIVSVFETTASRALGGYDAGVEDGQNAVQCAENLGQPHGSTIYFAVDFDAQDSQMGAVLDYIRGANDSSPNYSTGVYGSYGVIQACQNANVCSHFWQTYAWSHGNKATDIQIYQWKNDITVNNKQIDEDEGYENEGAWTLMNFKDVPAAHWAHDTIDKVSEAGIMVGYGDDTFKPDAPITRAEIAQVILNLLDKK